MPWLYVFVIFSFCLFLFFFARWILSVSPSQQRKAPHKSTMFDVRRLILKGETEAAARLYRQIFSTTPQEAKKAVEQLERSIKEKKPKRE